MRMPFPDASFDAVFSNGSLHEWEDPILVFDEINRVLKPEGLFCVTDMRRDVSSLIKWMIYAATKPKEIRPGFLSSLNASYTVDEIINILNRSALKNATVNSEFFGLCISGKKLFPDRSHDTMWKEIGADFPFPAQNKNLRRFLILIQPISFLLDTGFHD